MQYDPIKRTLGKVFNSTPLLRVLFYKMLDVLLLRSWHIARELDKWNASCGDEGKDILDAGCGFGQYSHRLWSLNEKHRVRGVDVKQEQMDDCNVFFDKIGATTVDFRVEDLTTYVEKERKYDLVLSVDVMEHILEDRKVFDNFYAMMKEGAMLLISTPSDKGGSDNCHHDEDEAHGFIDEHVRDGYGIEDITEKLKSAGFKRVEARYTYGTPGHISWLLSMKAPILMLNASKIFFIVLPFYYLAVMPWCLLLNLWDLYGIHEEGTGLLVKAVK